MIVRLEGSIGYNRPLFSGLSFTLSPGKIYCVIGPNGSGKSTLLKTISGALKPLEGEVEVEPPARSIYVPPDPPSLPGMRGGDVALSVLASSEKRILYGRWRSEEVLADVGRILNELGSSIDLEREFDQLSTGEKMKVMLASSIASDAKVLLLDEPTGHLDVRSRLSLYRILRREKNEKLFVVSMHEIAECSYVCEKVIALNARRLLGPLDIEEALREDLLRDLYGVDFRVLLLEGRRIPVPSVSS